MSCINFKHIACVFDFTEESRLALRTACSLAAHSSAELHIIHCAVNNASSAGFMVAGVPTYSNIFVDYANDELYQRTLQDAVKIVVPKNISTVIHLLSGTRIQNIVDLLQESQTDLCIIGIRNKTEWWKHLFSLPVTRQIINLAPCPVLAINSFSIHGENYAGSN